MLRVRVYASVSTGDVSQSLTVVSLSLCSVTVGPDCDDCQGRAFHSQGRAVGPSGVALDATGCPALDVPARPVGPSGCRAVGCPAVGCRAVGSRVPGLDVTEGVPRPMAYGRARAGRLPGVPCRRVGGCRAVRVRVAGCPSFGPFGMEGTCLRVVG